MISYAYNMNQIGQSFGFQIGVNRSSRPVEIRRRQYNEENGSNVDGVYADWEHSIS